MAEEGRGRASWRNIASAWLACVVALIVVGTALKRFPPSLWIAVPLLLIGMAALALSATRAKPMPVTRSLGLRRDAESWRTALQVWSWGNYPFLIAFVCWMLAEDQLDDLYGFGWALLILLASMVPLLVWGSLRRKQLRAQVADSPGV